MSARIKPFDRLRKSFDERKDHPTHKVTHLLLVGGKESYFYESELDALNAAYVRALSQHVTVEIFVSFLKLPTKSATPEATWKANEAYMSEHHANIMRWSDKYEGWFI